MSQSGIYAAMMEKVDSFRTLIGAPDMEKFNIVLLGGITVASQPSVYACTLQLF